MISSQIQTFMQIQHKLANLLSTQTVSQSDIDNRLNDYLENKEAYLDLREKQTEKLKEKLRQIEEEQDKFHK